MPFLLRVELPDVPGSLGRVATAIGEAGGDIEAIEIVEHRPDGTAVDDVLLETAPGAMPDSIVSACNKLDGVRVLWISRYAAGGNLFLDLEAVEELTGHPEHALDRLVEVLPDTFRADWGARIRRNGDGGAEILHATSAAPESLPWQGDLARPAPGVRRREQHPRRRGPASDDEVVVFGRRGGPDVLDSELARLGHLVALAASIARDAESREPAQALEQEQRDLAVGPLLVVRVRRELGDAALPPLRPLGALGDPGDVRVRLGAVLEVDLGVGEEVVVPGRVLRSAALGGDGGVDAVLLHAHHRVLAELARTSRRAR